MEDSSEVVEGLGDVIEGNEGRHLQLVRSCQNVVLDEMDCRVQRGMRIVDAAAPVAGIATRVLCILPRGNRIPG